MKVVFSLVLHQCRIYLYYREKNWLSKLGFVNLIKTIIVTINYPIPSSWKSISSGMIFVFYLFIYLSLRQTTRYTSQSHGLRPKRQDANAKAPPASIRVPTNDHLHRGHVSLVCWMRRLIMRYKPEIMQFFWHLYYGWGKHKKISVKRPSEGSAISHSLKIVPFRQMRSLGTRSSFITYNTINYSKTQ